MADKPKGVGLWVEVKPGEWVQLGSIEGPSLISYVSGFPNSISIGYDLKPGDMIPDVPKLKPDTPIKIDFTLKDFQSTPALEELKKFAQSEIDAAFLAAAKSIEDDITKVFLYGTADPNAPEPIGIFNGTEKTKGLAWTVPPLKFEDMLNLLPPFPPNHFNCKCALPSLEEPPPMRAPNWRDVEAAFMAASARIPLEAPAPAELEAELAEHFGSTDPVVKVKE